MTSKHYVSRRSFCMTAAATGMLPVLPRLASAHQTSTALEATELRPGIWAVTGGGGNTLVMKTDGGPIIIDTKVGTAGQALLDKAKTLLGTQQTAMPWTIINTHHHGDHIGGNFRFTGAGLPRLEIIAHAHMNPRVEDSVNQRVRPGLMEAAKNNIDEQMKLVNLSAADFKATKSFADTHRIERTNETLHLHHHSNAHTDNDTTIRLEKANILHMGDLVFHELHPFIDVAAGADTTLWQGFLDVAYETCDKDTVVIPGHGEITDRAGIKAMSTYFDQLREVVSREMKAGKPREEIVAMKPEVFNGRGFERMQSMNLGVMVDELAAQRQDSATTRPTPD